VIGKTQGLFGVAHLKTARFHLLIRIVDSPHSIKEGVRHRFSPGI